MVSKNSVIKALAGYFLLQANVASAANADDLFVPSLTPPRPCSIIIDGKARDYYTLDQEEQIATELESTGRHAVKMPFIEDYRGFFDDRGPMSLEDRDAIFQYLLEARLIEGEMEKNLSTPCTQDDLTEVLKSLQTLYRSRRHEGLTKPREP